MRLAALLIGVPLTLLGLFWSLTGWFGPQIGDGFTNIGRAILGPVALVIGAVLSVVGIPALTESSTTDSSDSQD